MAVVELKRERPFARWLPTSMPSGPRLEGKQLLQKMLDFYEPGGRAEVAVRDERPLDPLDVRNARLFVRHCLQVDAEPARVLNVRWSLSVRSLLARSHQLTGVSAPA